MTATFNRLYKVIRGHLGFDVSRISPRVKKKIYVERANLRNCNGHCCRGGTTASVAERDRILAHEKIVREAMTSKSRDDASSWFCRRVMVDDDFTAGKAVYTRVRDGACVFYRKTDGLCALQVASGAHLRTPYALKPSVCLLWPMSVRDHTIEPGYADFTRRKDCCAPVRDGKKTLLKIIVPDEKLILQMSRRRYSRGGGPVKRARAG